MNQLTKPALFNLITDPSETTDVSDQNADIVKK